MAYSTDSGLMNVLLQQQLNNQVDYKSTPAYLNSQLANTRTQSRTAWDTSRNTAYQTARNNILNQFKELGDPNGATPYLDLLQKDFDSLAYRQGSDFSYDGPQVSTAWDEDAYLRANPDVAANLADTNSRWDRVNDPNYWHTGLDQYLADPNRAARGGVSPGFMNPGAMPNVMGGSPDTWDDPNSLLNKDYGVGQAVTGIRQGRKDTTYNNSLGTARSILSGMGLSEADIANLSGKLDTAFGTTYQNAGVSANDYTGVFDPQSVLDSVLGTERSQNRTKLTGLTNAAFGGLDPNAAFSDTADDQYINDIVGKQYDDAYGAVERAYRRGALTNTGYQSGMSYLGDQRKTADSTAQTLGGAVLTRDRGTLSGIKNDATTAAGSWDFGKALSPDSYVTQYNDKQKSLSEGLSGDIASALAGQNWFNVGDVLNKAGYAQGAQNTAALTDGFTTPQGMAVAKARNDDKAASRGLGGTGLF